MATTGFVLITCAPGREKAVYDFLDAMSEIDERFGLFGEYDIIARITADSTTELTRIVINKIREIDGIVDTKTLIGTEL